MCVTYSQLVVTLYDLIICNFSLKKTLVNLGYTLCTTWVHTLHSCGSFHNYRPRVWEGNVFIFVCYDQLKVLMLSLRF